MRLCDRPFAADGTQALRLEALCIIVLQTAWLGKLRFGERPLPPDSMLRAGLAQAQVRHGCVSPEQPGYLQLVASLRQGDCS